MLGADLGIVYTKKRSAINYGGERIICAKPYHDYYLKLELPCSILGALVLKMKANYISFKNVNRYWEQFDTLQV